MDEKLREKFEAWFSDGDKWPQAIERSRDGYKLITAQNGWEAWQACTAALSQPAAAEPATKSEIELAWFHICGDYGNPLKLSALRTGRALDAVLQARAKAPP